MINASDSIEIEIELFEADGTTPLDFSAALGALFVVYQKPGNKVAHYSQNALAGFTTMAPGQLSAANIGKATLYLDSAQSTKLDPNKTTYAEARIGLANANFAGGVQTLTATDIELEIVTRPQLENISTV